MIKHEVILHWNPNGRTVSVEHINEPKKGQAQINDTITFKADPPAQVEITFKGSNFSGGTDFVITDSNPHVVARLGDFPFECAAIEANGTRHDQTPGDGTKHPAGT